MKQHSFNQVIVLYRKHNVALLAFTIFVDYSDVQKTTQNCSQVLIVELWYEGKYLVIFLSFFDPPPEDTLPADLSHRDGRG